ncbi:MAG TPA: ABC transporter ATP-binding protein, partial [Nitrospirales bacterium]|nr:ABC transporter ATP-binding protein [Nitrospirales bacterium]
VIENLTKTFKPGWPGKPSLHALAGLSLTVQKGEIYGFLGPNGAGKTTTLKILVGLSRATSGTAEILGRPVGDVAMRGRIGFLPEGPYFYDYLTGEEFLRFAGELTGLHGANLSRRVARMLDQVGLSDAGGRQLRKYSKGMLQRVGLAQALIHDPELVILDEPMSGLDPLGRKHIRDVILSLRAEGKTVFFSSHIIPDVEMICDRVGIIAKGRLVTAGRVDELMSAKQARSVEVVCEGVTPKAASPFNLPGLRIVQQGRRCLFVLPDPAHLDPVLTAIRSQGGSLISVTPEKHSLEELFLDQPEKPRA